jgi:two-component system cell cycle response regulator DivK
MQRETSPSRQRASTASAPKPPHLLSVEDNPQTRMVLKHLLGEDYRLTFASGVEGALDAVGSNRSFDLFLLDINLGAGKDGMELLRLLRNREDTADVPAIALTAYAMPGDREDLLSEGFDEYVGKPFSGEELTETIDQVLKDTGS